MDNTRPRDFYDVYMLSSLNYDSKMLKEAFIATTSHRESLEKISDSAGIIKGNNYSPNSCAGSKEMPYICLADSLNIVLRRFFSSSGIDLMLFLEAIGVSRSRTL